MVIAKGCHSERRPARLRRNAAGKASEESPALLAPLPIKRRDSSSQKALLGMTQQGRFLRSCIWPEAKAFLQ
jgi:hypothetical protein